MNEPLTSAPQTDARWAAFERRDPSHDGEFVIAVRTTKIYCRPSCPAKRPLRRNVVFFALPREAEAAGYRACKRCRPNEMSPRQRDALAVEAACRAIEEAEGPLDLETLAGVAQMSRHHFHRTFKAHVGLTPRAYASARRTARSVAALLDGERVADAAFASGYGSLTQFYEAAGKRFGMAPSAVRAGAHGETILTAQRRTPLGVVSAAFSARGVCGVVLADTLKEGQAAIEARFPKARFVSDDRGCEAALDVVLAAMEEPALAEELPLDIRGTAFEERVWAALRTIPAGTTRTYGEVADLIGAPTAHRAVARACGANRHAVVIPCHRVVRADGGLGGYRWGLSRKKALLAKEKRDG